MKIAVLDVDKIHNQRLATILTADTKVNLVFCETMSELLEVLGGDQTIELKKQAMEKTLADGKAMLARTSLALEKARLTEATRKNQISTANLIAQEPERQSLSAELAGIQAAIAKSEDLKSKLTRAIASKEAEIAALSSQIPTQEQKKVHLVMVDRSQLGNIPSDWTIDLRHKITLPENRDVPIATMGYNEDLEYIKKTVHGGVVDYFVKPVDPLLLKHNVGKLADGKVAADDKMFTLTTKAEIQFFKTASVVNLSEFEVTIQTDTSFREKEIIEFYVKDFTGQRSQQNGSETGQKILACCDRLDSDPAGGFLARFSFIGHTPQTMNEMRRWLRSQYILLKRTAK